MFNNVSGKGFSDAFKEITKMIKELKALLWIVPIAVTFIWKLPEIITALAR